MPRAFTALCSGFFSGDADAHLFAAAVCNVRRRKWSYDTTKSETTSRTEHDAISFGYALISVAVRKLLRVGGQRALRMLCEGELRVRSLIAYVDNFQDCHSGEYHNAGSSELELC